MNAEWYVEIIRIGRWRYRLVMCAESRGRVFRSGVYGTVWGRANAEQHARELLAEMQQITAGGSPGPKVVATIRAGIDLEQETT